MPDSLNNASSNTQAANTELAYFPEQSRADSSAVAWIQFIIPLLFAIAIAILGFPQLALAGAAAVVIVQWVRRKRRRSQPHAILLVESDTVSIRWTQGKEPFRVVLDDLLNVTLDTKEIQRVQENPAGAPQLRFINSRVGPGIDVARIVFDARKDYANLTEEYLSHLDCTEWLPKIRLFLRSHGWVPESEREAPKAEVEED